MCFIKTIINIVIISIISSISHIALADIYFKQDCQTQIINLIKHSDKTIDIAVYSINNYDIIDSLIDAKNRGVQIRILTDRLQAFGGSSKVTLLHDEGFDIKVHSHDKIMHHKFAIFDNKKAVQGSFNWTYAAANKNAEDCNVFNVEQDIETLNTRFKELWHINTKDTSDCYIDNIEKEKSERDKC